MSRFLFSASSVSVSAWTLVAISCERYYAICHPLRSRRWQTLKHSYKLIALIWCGSLICMSPIAFLSQLIPTSNGKISTHKLIFSDKKGFSPFSNYIFSVFTFWLWHSSQVADVSLEFVVGASITCDFFSLNHFTYYFETVC